MMKPSPDRSGGKGVPDGLRGNAGRPWRGKLSKGSVRKPCCDAAVAALVVRYTVVAPTVKITYEWVMGAL
jgi:hypothetical protein